MLEKDLYNPIKTLLEELGYVVKAEVNSTDITAIKDNNLVIIEMKKNITLKLLYQACVRQKLTDEVYIAVPKPNYKTLRSKAFKEKEFLLRRLHLGLILVGKTAEIIIEPKPFDIKISKGRSKKKKTKLIDEFNNRKTNYNIGGVTRTKIITAYREQVITIATHLKDGPKKVKELKDVTTNPKTGDILLKNYYKWFKRIDRGVYDLTEQGHKELESYKHVVDSIKK